MLGTPCPGALAMNGCTRLAHAVAHARYETAVLRDGAVVFRYGGVMTTVLEHRDGAWRILQGHTSSER